MPSLSVLASFLDGNFADIFNSTFIVPCFGTIMILGIVVAGIWSGVRTREIQSVERLAAIAKGLPPEPVWDKSSLRSAIEHSATGDLLTRSNNGSTSRRAGILLISVAIGLAAFFIALWGILHVRGLLIPAAVGLIPAAIGGGFLIDAQIRAAELSRLLETARASDAVSLQTPASASELRPLH